MNTSLLMPDLAPWLTWASNAVYVACFLLGVVAIVIVTCVVAQIVTAHKKRLPIAH
jgi:hypothetical protein